MAIERSNLDFISAIEAARAIRRGEVSSLDLTKNIFERIEKYNPNLNAVVTILKDDALNRARAADQAMAKGELWGPLHGVPCSIKDTIEIANVLTTAGSPELATHIPKKDAVVVERLLRAGAVIIGHTNVPLLAADLQSYNEIFGTTNNPWDHKLTPGGSTGGGAAAVAAGLSYLSIGSDIGGSIRIPSHFCGVFGHKPSLNVVPRHGHIPPP
ncbi:MAG: glutamyl-tRNA amidotransferase, partial [Candidatus Lokiarchaeota archaeon]|nr:glutamyl-tRNA amidotransferase [Candidatus Lokiarchaeota archaeon]